MNCLGRAMTITSAVVMTTNVQTSRIDAVAHFLQRTFQSRTVEPSGECLSQTISNFSKLLD